MAFVRVLAKRTLREFWRKHADSEQMLRAWHDDVRGAVWRSPADLRRVYATASVLPGNRIVFNVKGNTYRLVVKVNYDFGVVYIRFVGTHAEYDRIDAATI